MVLDSRSVFPPAVNEGSFFSTTFPTVVIFLLIVVLLAGMRSYLIVVLICVSLIASELSIFSYIRGRGAQNTEFILRNCAFILTCLNFSHLQSTFHLMQNTCQDFIQLFKTVLNSSILMLFSAFVVFFTSSTLAKHLPLRTFFILGTKKVTWDKIG